MGSDRGLIDPWQIGLDHERSSDPSARQVRGAWYTPRRLVERLVAVAVPDRESVPSLALDPACGGGAFLLGVLDRLVALGLDPVDALRSVRGTDIDSGAVAAANEAIAAWGAINGASVDKPVVSQGDAMESTSAGGHEIKPDLIIGNPPFATPLKGNPFPALADEYRLAHRDRFGPYADLSAIHLARAVDRCAPTGRVAFVLPQSLLAARDVAGLRTELEPATAAVWASAKLLFDANVRVWAPLIDLSAQGTGDSVKICSDFDDDADLAGQPMDHWPSLVAGALGAPQVVLDGEPLGGRVKVTAGFRDEYYAIAAACRELPLGDQLGSDEAMVITVGSIDPLEIGWGERPTRLAKRDWHRPVVSIDDVGGSSGAWLRRLLTPKVLLPTQSKVLEPVIDRAGTMAPITPVLAVQVADESDDGLSLEHLAVMFLAPHLSAWALRHWFGTALSPTAMKLPAKGVSLLPMPPPAGRSSWDRAAELLRKQTGDDAAGDLVGLVAQIMIDAYAPLGHGKGESEDDGDGSAVFQWWDQRRPS